MNVVQIPIAPLLACGVITVALVAGLSLMVWLWAMRKPVPGEKSRNENEEERTPVYVAVGAQIGLGLDSGADVDRNWADLLKEKMPEGTRLVLLGRRGITLAELNKVEIPAAVKASPDIVTLWSVVSDATKGVELAAYIKELHHALTTLLKGTQAEVMLLNLPDISLLTQDVSDERRSLIRGGVAQWNKAIAEAVPRYGKRVRLIDLFPISDQLLGSTKRDGESEASPASERNHLLADTVWAAMLRPAA